VHILIFFPNKIFLSTFWLEIWWDVANTEIHLFCKFGGVSGCWLAEKWFEPQNSPKIRVFSPLTPRDVEAAISSTASASTPIASASRAWSLSHL